MNETMHKEPNKRSLSRRKFVQLLSINHSRIYSYILLLVPNQNAADDIMQDTCMVMYEKSENFQVGTNFLAWARAIAKYQILYYLKKNKRDRTVFNSHLLETLDSRSKAFFEGDKDDEAIHILKKCLSKLSSPDSHLIIMRYYNNLDTKSIASQLGVSFQHIYRNLARIHGRLVECFQQTNVGVSK